MFASAPKCVGSNSVSIRPPSLRAPAAECSPTRVKRALFAWLNLCDSSPGIGGSIPSIPAQSVIEAEVSACRAAHGIQHRDYGRARTRPREYVGRAYLLRTYRTARLRAARGHA